jgi:hypothetical protein
MIFSMLFETRRSTLGLVTLDILVTEDLDLPSIVTQYPVEDGGPEISDHITQGNEKLTINGSVTNANMEAFDLGSTSSKIMDVIESFREMHKDRKPIKVVTGIGVYEDMGFNGVTITRGNSEEKGGNWIDIKADLIKVVKVKLEEGDLPPEQVSASDNGGKTKGKAGKTESKYSKTGEKKPSDGVYKSVTLTGMEKGGIAPSKDYYRTGVW